MAVKKFWKIEEWLMDMCNPKSFVSIKKFRSYAKHEMETQGNQPELCIYVCVSIQYEKYYLV